jgi:hypothetical protein
MSLIFIFGWIWDTIMKYRLRYFYGSLLSKKLTRKVKSVTSSAWTNNFLFIY